MLAHHVGRACAALLVTLLMLATGVATSPAHAGRGDGWSRPRVLEPRDVSASRTPTYASQGGRTVVAWLSETVVQPAAQPWEDPAVRTDVRVRRVRGDGRLGSPRTVHSTLHSVHGLQVAMDASGDLVVGWTEYREETAGWRPWVRRVPRRGAPTPPRLVWGEGSETSLSDVAMTPDGTAVVTWLQPRLDASGATLPALMLLRRVRADGSLSPVTDLGMTGNTATAVAGDDAFWVAGVIDPIDGLGSSGGIRVVRVTTRGRVALSRTLDPGPTAAEPGLESSAPQLTLDASQDARVVWSRYDSVRGGNEIVGRVWRRRGSLGRETVIRSGHDALASIATDARGHSFVTWVSLDTDDFEGFGRRWDRRGRLGPVQRFGTAAWEDLSATVVHGPVAAVDDAGRGVVVWGHQEDGGPDGRIETRVRRIRPDGRTTRLPGLDLGPPDGVHATADGLVLLGFDRQDATARLVVRR